MEKREYKPGQHIFKAGEKSDEMYLLLEGEIGIFLPSNESKEPNFLITGNEIFGEMGVIEDELRSASARAMNPTKIVAVTKKEFEAKANAADPFVKGVLRILSTRIREMNKANR